MASASNVKIMTFISLVSILPSLEKETKHKGLLKTKASC